MVKSKMMSKLPYMLPIRTPPAQPWNVMLAMSMHLPSQACRVSYCGKLDDRSSPTCVTAEE